MGILSKKKEVIITVIMHSDIPEKPHFPYSFFSLGLLEYNFPFDSLKKKRVLIEDSGNDFLLLIHFI